MSGKNWKRRKASETRAILHERFPNCFVGRGLPKLPLKLGIFADICERAPDISRGRISIALFDYCLGPTYLSNVIEGALRIDLDGKPAGFVTGAEAKDAARKELGIKATFEAEDQIRELRKALQPFAYYFALNDCDAREDDDALEVPIGDLRRAHQILNGTGAMVTESGGAN